MILIDQFRDYQITWLTSHCDIELEPKLENLIIRFLRDTAERFNGEYRCRTLDDFRERKGSEGEGMRNVKCEDCEEYRNQWCEKVIDSPHPDILRDCQYFHERDKDIVKVVRCRDCKHYRTDNPKVNGYHCCWRNHNIFPMGEHDFCSRAERKDSEEDNVNIFEG